MESQINSLETRTEKMQERFNKDLVSAAVLFAIGYMTVAEVQQRFGVKALGRKMTGIGLPEFVIIRSKVWRRLM